MPITRTMEIMADDATGGETGSTSGGATDDVATITREELQGKIERGDDFALFEVLPEMYWRKHHLPGARSLPPREVTALVPRLVPDRRAEIVVYCWDFT